MGVKASEREGRRHSIGIRVTTPIKDWLDRRSSESGRSLAQEIETTCELQALGERAFGSPETYRLLLAFAQFVPDIEAAAAKHCDQDAVTWMDDPTGIVKQRMMRALGEAIEFARAMRELTTPEEQQAIHSEFAPFTSN